MQILTIATALWIATGHGTESIITAVIVLFAVTLGLKYKYQIGGRR